MRTAVAQIAWSMGFPMFAGIAFPASTFQSAMGTWRTELAILSKQSMRATFAKPAQGFLPCHVRRHCKCGNIEFPSHVRKHFASFFHRLFEDFVLFAWVSNLWKLHQVFFCVSHPAVQWNQLFGCWNRLRLLAISTWLVSSSKNRWHLRIIPFLYVGSGKKVEKLTHFETTNRCHQPVTVTKPISIAINIINSGMQAIPLPLCQWSAFIIQSLQQFFEVIQHYRQFLILQIHTGQAKNHKPSKTSLQISSKERGKKRGTKSDCWGFFFF